MEGILQVKFLMRCFVLKCAIDIKSALVSVISWRPTGDKSLPGPMMTYFADAYILPGFNYFKLHYDQSFDEINDSVSSQIFLMHYNDAIMGARASQITPDNKCHGATMGPILGRQDPGGPHVGPMNFAIWDLPHDCLFNRLCRCKWKKTGEFPTQRTSNAENISIWWRHPGNNLNHISLTCGNRTHIFTY